MVMAPLPGLVKDTTPPATDTQVAPIVIPDGTILITTKQHNKIIDYLSGDAGPDFIPQLAINNLVSDLSGKEDSLGFTPEDIANKGTANGYAPLVSSLVPIANLGTGTPDGTLFLRDDGTFVNPQTPWEININANGKNLSDLDILSFVLTASTTIPDGATNAFIMYTDEAPLTGLTMLFNVPTLSEFTYHIAGVPILSASVNGFDFWGTILSNITNINLESTSNPLIRLKRLNASAGDTLATIFAESKTPTHKYIEIDFVAVDITDTSEVGSIDFKVSFAGSLKSYITINKDGLDIIDFNDVALVKIPYIGDLNNNEIVSFANVASAVNFAEFSNAATGDEVLLSALGDDTDVSFRFIPKGTGTFYGTRETWGWPLTDETTLPTTGVKYVTEPAPYDMEIEDAVGGLTEFGSGASLFTIDILKEDGVNNNSFTTIFTDKITINDSAYTSTTATTPPTFNTTSWEKGKRLQLSITQLDSNLLARGVKVELICHAVAK